jgi:hypothetical protein
MNVLEPILDSAIYLNPVIWVIVVPFYVQGMNGS